MVQSTAIQSEYQAGSPGVSYLFEDHFPNLAAAMDRFAELTQMADFNGDVDRRGTSCWPWGLSGPSNPVEDSYEGGEELSKENYILFKDRVRESFRPLFYEELTQVVPEWLRLSAVKDNSVELHSYLVLYLTWIDRRLEAYTPRQVNILKWATLLHDVSKRGLPEFKGRDHTHPFVGGKTVLAILHRLGFLQADLGDTPVNLESLRKVYELVDGSVNAPVDPSYGKSFEKNEKYCKVVHSHGNLEEIFDLLWTGGILVRGSFSDLIFRLIFFHQSLLGLERHPPMTQTTREERQRYCDKEFLQLMLTLMSNDSASYTFLKDVTLMHQFNQEFHRSHLAMMREIGAIPEANGDCEQAPSKL